MLLLLILSFHVALYSDRGVWENGKIALIQMFTTYGHQIDTVNASLINSGIPSGYDLLIIPGGWAVNYRRRINDQGLANIRNFVSSGGIYLGICAGSYFAADSIEWEGRRYDYPLNLYEGIAIGAIDPIAPWPQYNMSRLLFSPEARTGDSIQYVLYYGGPYFQGGVFDTLAIYTEVNKPAIIKFQYGSGWVVLSGVHPEIEEDSDRDSTNFASELPDSGSDWGWFIHILESLRVGIKENQFPALLLSEKEIKDAQKVFTLDGRILKGRPRAGIYFIRFNGKFRKVLIIPR